MIIELGSIHAKGKQLIEGTCMLPPNRNVTMFIGLLLSKCEVQLQLKGRIYDMEGTGVAKLM
jgi:hypothetical protein